MITYIYILQDPITKCVRYVGKTNNPKLRKRSHLWKYDKNKSYCYKWVNSLLNKGLKPIFTVIDEINGDWEWLEIYWIEQFKSWGYKLTNITKGGEGAYGSGKWNNKPVSVFDLNGNFIRSFESQKDCAYYFNTSASNVKQCVNGRNKSFLKKYQVKLGIIKNNILPLRYKRKYNKTCKKWGNTKSIICIEDNKVFESLSEASKYYSISISTISNNLNKRSKKTKNGKSFEYHESVRSLRISS